MARKKKEKPKYEAVAGTGEITLFRNKEDGKLHLEADDPFYSGSVTSQVAKDFIEAFVNSPLLDLTEEQKVWVVRFLFPPDNILMPDEEDRTVKSRRGPSPDLVIYDEVPFSQEKEK